MTTKNPSIYLAEPKALDRDAVSQLASSLDLPTSAPEAAKFVLGWREWLSLPDLKIPAIKAKIDTGARTSALHTHDYSLYKSGGKEMVRFHLHPLRRTDTVEVTCEAEILDLREVRDSGGHPELRPFISTTAQIGDFQWPVELSLTNRESMKFRMLLGRQALAGYFLIDSFKSHLMGRNRSGAYRK